MIKQEIYLDEEDWRVTVFYAVTHFEVGEIMRTLEAAGCRGKDLERSYENITSGNLNTGLCFSGDGESVMVISVTSSKPQFFNSLVHELHHLSTHIAKGVGYKLTGEEVCYLAGEIAQEMYAVAGKYLCECCGKRD